MKRTQRGAVRTTVITGLAICLWLAGLWSVAAQPPERGHHPPMNPEQMKGVWKIEAATVAQHIVLSAELTTKLTDAYLTAREKFGTAMTAQMKPGERPNFEVMNKIRQDERAALETAIKAFLTEEQTAKAIAPLGSFQREWDMMVQVLDSMGLTEPAKTNAMNRVLTFVLDTTSARQKADPSASWEAMRETNRALKQAIDADMAKILSADQMAKWTEATSRHGRGRPGGMGRPGEEGRPGPPPPPPQ